MEDGRLKKVLPPLMPVSRPRSTISMPSVTMKPLRRNRTISRPLTQPMARPTARVIGIDHAPDSQPRPCVTPGASTSQAATPGASPNVDSSDRSIRPAISTSASASTSSEISDCCCSTLTRLSQCRNTGLTKYPTMPITMIAGTSARSRRRASRGAVVRPGAGAAKAVCVSVTDALHRGDQFVVGPSLRHLGDDGALEQGEHPVAGAKVVQVVGDDQDAGAADGRRGGRSQQRLLRLDVDSGGGLHQYEHLG